MTATEFKNTIIPVYGTMLAISRKILRNEDADDIVQDVVRDLWEKREKIAINIDPARYALQCVKNRCIDFLRCEHPQININELTSISYEDSNEEIEYMQQVRGLNEAIRRLSEPAKSVILLNLKGESAKNISKIINLSEANIRQILSRTRRKLREILINN